MLRIVCFMWRVTLVQELGAVPQLANADIVRFSCVSVHALVFGLRNGWGKPHSRASTKVPGFSSTCCSQTDAHGSVQ